MARVICLVVLSATVAYTLWNHGGDPPADWAVSLVGLALAGILSAGLVLRQDIQPRLTRAAFVLAFLFPAYVACQLIPLPLPLLHVLSPVRWEIARALEPVGVTQSFAPLTIAPAATAVHLSRVLACVLVFLAAWVITKSRRSQAWLCALPLLVFAAIEAAVALIQLAYSPDQIIGTLPDRDFLAGFLEMLLPLAIAGGIAAVRPGSMVVGSVRSPLSLFAYGLRAVAVWLVALASVFAIVSSGSKMGFLAMLLSLSFMAAFALHRRLAGWRKWLALASLVLFFFLGILALPSEKLIDQMRTAAADHTLEGRLPIWKDTLHVVGDYPVFGSGLGSFNVAILRRQTAEFAVAWIWAHNDFLQFLSELGILGFLIPAALLYLVFLTALRAASRAESAELRLLALGCASGILAITLHCVTEYHMYVPAIAMVLAWMAGIAIALRSSRSERRPAPPSALRRYLAPVALAASLALGFYGVAWWVFLHRYGESPQAEQAFCHFGVCDTWRALGEMKTAAQHSGAPLSPAAVAALVRREPAGPADWCELGDAFYKAHDLPAARYAYARSLALAPRIPYILYRNGLFHLALGEKPQSIQLMTEALASNPMYGDNVFNAYRQNQIPVRDVLLHGLPNGDSYLGYLRELIGEKRTGDAQQVWNALLAHGYADVQTASYYVNYLFQQTTPELAVQAWAQYAHANPEGYPERNRVFNGGFESEPVGSPFDWRFYKVPGSSIAFDRTVAHSGRRSVRVDFDDTQNLTVTGLNQVIFLPAGRYHFRAFLRSDNVITNEGLYFEVITVRGNNGIRFTTDSIDGTTPWKQVDHTFVVPPGAGLMEVRLVRNASMCMDCTLRGTVWVDDVSISPLSSGSSAAPVETASVRSH